MTFLCRKVLKVLVGFIGFKKYGRRIGQNIFRSITRVKRILGTGHLFIVCVLSKILKYSKVLDVKIRWRGSHATSRMRFFPFAKAL